MERGRRKKERYVILRLQEKEEDKMLHVHYSLANNDNDEKE
jgi:hypothetical protein